MISTNENQFVFPAWGASLTVHGVVVGLVCLVATQVTPVLQENLFQWDVALVESTSPDSTSKEIDPVQTPDPRPTKPVVAARTRSVHDAPQPVMAAMPSEQKIEPLQRTVEPVPPIEQNGEIPQLREEPREQQRVEMASPPVESTVEVKEANPQPVQQESVAVASAPVASSDLVQSQEVPAPAAPSQNEETLVAHVAKASPSGGEMKADHRWLAEALWRRVAELKRYPSSARMSGQEGKVILKAVIRSDGQLADVSIQKSSGYELLDVAAIEAVKLACPLHMKHALGKPQIVVSLPIVYSLLTP